MTKAQVINFVKSELECGCSVLAATLGNGGSGYGLVTNPGFPKYLEHLEFVGIVEPSNDIIQSAYYDPSWQTYQFNGSNGFCVQIQAI